MSSVDMHPYEVRYYASPVLIKNREFYATLTSERLIIEGSSTREFRISSIDKAYPQKLENNEPGLRLVISTPAGKKEIIFAFPVDAIFKAGEQEAWVENISKATGDRPFEQQGQAAARQSVSASAGSGFVAGLGTRTGADASGNNQSFPPPSFKQGEVEVLNTSGVRIKRGYYTIYLTNLRLILQNNFGKVGREFAIAEITDAAEMESETGEPEIALSVGSQTGQKQMILTFPTKMSRDAWIRELKVKLPQQKPLIAQTTAGAGASQAPQRVGMFVPAQNEKLLMSSKDVRIKSNFAILHLTNTRLVIENRAGIVGEFAVNSLLRAMRMAGEIGEPGIALLVGSLDGEREMHLIFQSMNLREDWMRAFEGVILPEPAAMFVNESEQYTVSKVMPHQSQNTNEIYCRVCGAVNHIDDDYCAMCGKPLRERRAEANAAPDDEDDDFVRATSERREKEKKEKKVKEPKPKKEPKPRKEKEPKEPKEPKERKMPNEDRNTKRRPYDGGFIGFVTRPTDAFQFYFRESPKDALLTFFLSGGIWALATSLLTAFVVPLLLKIDAANYPVLSSIQSNPIALVVFVLVMLVIWMIAVMIRALVCSLIAKLCDPEVEPGVVIAIVMRTALTHAFVGWIPFFGIFAAGIWSAVSTAKGLVVGENMHSSESYIASVASLAVVFSLLFAVGILMGA